MASKLKRGWVKFLLFASVIGPGIIAGSANNDAGGISTYSYAGSKFGYALLWILVLNLITLACTQQMGVRLGVFTGKGLASLIRERFGVRWTLLAVLTLILANLAVCTSEFAGIAASLELFGVSKWISAPIFAILVWLILYKGSFKKIERLFLFISALFLVYVVSAVMAKPDWSEVAKASITPFLSSDRAFFLALLGVMGTTITPWGQFFLQSYVVDKGISVKNYFIEKWEIYFSAFFTCFIAVMIIITTKNVLFDHGIVVDSAEKAAMSLAPILGNLAEIIFGFGFFAASLLGAFILPLTTSYCVCEALGFEHGVDRKLTEAPTFYGLMAFMILCAAIFVLLPIFSLFQIMIFAQVVNGMLLPIILIFLIILFNGGEKLGLPPLRKTSSFLFNLVTWTVIICLIAISLLLVALTLFPSII
jgi:Mn2+/Fe2+ NRAMP family transporter